MDNSKGPQKKSLKDTPAAPEGEGRVKPDAHACIGSDLPVCEGFEHWISHTSRFAGTFLLQYFLLVCGLRTSH